MTEDTLLRIERPDAPLGEKVVAAVRDAISGGALVPGQRLTERELMERTGVSRTSIREALRQLHTLGLVERGPNSGLRVAVLDQAAIAHIYEARGAIETLAAELFVLRATDEEVSELLHIMDKYGASVPAKIRKSAPARQGGERRSAEAIAPNLAYDELLLRGARNPILTDMLAPLHTRIQGLRRLSLTMPGRFEASFAEVEEILDAIKARDPKRAAEATRLHIAAAGKSALKAAELSTSANGG